MFIFNIMKPQHPNSRTQEPLRNESRSMQIFVKVSAALAHTATCLNTQDAATFMKKVLLAPERLDHDLSAVSECTLMEY